MLSRSSAVEKARRTPGSATGAARLEHEPDREAVEQRGHAAQVVGVGVGDDDRGQRADAVPLEKRGHHPAPRIAPLTGRARRR